MKFVRKFRALFRRRKLEAEMREEMQAHLEMLVERKRAGGMTGEDARYAALREFGGVEQIKERCREQRAWTWLEQFVQDLRFGVRGLARSRGFTAVAVLTLALGIGMTTSIFSVVYGVLLDPYPYARSGEIWAPIVTDAKTGQWVGLRIADYLGMAQSPGVASAMATSPGMVALSGGINPEMITGVRVTGTAFRFLGVPPVIGRGLTAADCDAAGEPRAVTVLSFKLWQRLFNGDPAALGRTVMVDDVPHVVIGVMPPRFGWYTNDGLWLPLSTRNRDRYVIPIVRLKPDVTAAVAAQQLSSVLVTAARREPGRYPSNGMDVHYDNYLNITVASGQMRTSLLLLLGAVGFLLLIVCTNVANLQLARGVARHREMAVRLALGAGRGRLVRQLLTESLGLSLTGGGLGVVFAFGLLRLIVLLLPEYYVPNEARIALNLPVLVFSAALAVLAGVLSGLVPSWQCTRRDANEALKDGGAAVGGSHRGNRTRNALVVTQVALSVTLLVGASLSLRGFVAAMHADPGFNMERMLLLEIPLNPKRYTTFTQRNEFFRDFLERVRALPGVRDATLGTPPGTEADSPVTIAGRPSPAGGVALNFIDTHYLRTLGISLKVGRNLTPNEVAEGRPVALISEAMAKLWGVGESPLGRVMTMSALASTDDGALVPAHPTKAVTVVGIIADTWAKGRQQPAPAAVLVPWTLAARRERAVMVRTVVDPVALVSAARSELRSLDPEQPMQRPWTFEELRRQDAQPPRFNFALLGVLAGCALVLAAAGIYGVLAYSVAQRTREIGLRMALGADGGAVVRLFVGLGARLLVTGLAIGLAASAALAQVVNAAVFGEQAFDPAAFVAPLLLLSGTALVASWLPARRAAKVDPAVMLRCE